MWKKISWFFRGKPKKIFKGGWCGCCGTWVGKVEFTFPDYYEPDSFWDLNTLCEECSKPPVEKFDLLGDKK